MDKILTKDDIRAAGGIVHSDGNMFFTNVEMLNATILAKLADKLEDAERYRWLREQIEKGPLVIAKVSEFDGLISWSGDDPDSAIDAARKGKA